MNDYKKDAAEHGTRVLAKSQSLEQSPGTMPTYTIETVDVDSRTQGIAIVGMSQVSRHLAPWEDATNSWNLWCLNNAHRHFATRAHRWYDLHSHREIERMVTEHAYEPDHLESLRKMSIPVYVLAGELPEVPKALPYPLEEVRAAAPELLRNYFTSSIAYMIAHAYLDITEGRFAPRIGVWGVELGMTTEYGREKACVESWLIACAQKGIEVVLPAECSLFRSPYFYGYEDALGEDRTNRLNTREQELSLVLRKNLAQFEVMRASIDQLKGMISEVQWMRQNLTYQGTVKAVSHGEGQKDRVDHAEEVLRAAANARGQP